MVKLRVPSVQHLARNWDVSPKKIEDAFVKMALNPPFFNYNALNDVARDSLLFGSAYQTTRRYEYPQGIVHNISILRKG